MMPNPSVNQTACKLRLQVPSALRAPAAGYVECEPDMDPTKAAAAFPALEARIRAVLVENDPSGLFGAGAPSDEHDTEVHAIVSRLRRAATEAEVAAILGDVLGGWMDGAGKNRTALCDRMAPQVWEAWRAFTSTAD